MQSSRREPWGPIAGLVFVVLFLVGVMLLDIPEGDASVQEITSFYNDGGERAQLIISSYLLVLAGVFFLWFLASLRRTLIAAEGEPARLTAIAFAGGVVFVGLLMAAACTFMTVAADITFGDEKFVSADAARLLPELGYPLLFIGAMFAAIAMIDAASVVIMRTRVLPTWIGWFGFVAAVALLFGFLFFPMLFLLVWVAAVSGSLLTARAQPGAPAAGAPPGVGATGPRTDLPPAGRTPA
jgi:hypothetical protein